MAKYRVNVDMVENGYVDVEAVDEAQAIVKAGEEIDEGYFTGMNSHADLKEVIKNE